MTMKRMVMPVLMGFACTLALSTSAAQAGILKIHSKKIYTLEEESARTLKNMDEQAYDLYDHAVTLHAGTRADTMDRDFFLGQLETVKEDVNRIGKEIARLEALSNFESSEEQSAVNRAKPLLQKVAATTEANLAFLRERPHQTDFPAYRTLAASLSDQTEALWKGLHDAVALAGISKKEQRLRKDLNATD